MHAARAAIESLLPEMAAGYRQRVAGLDSESVPAARLGNFRGDVCCSSSGDVSGGSVPAAGLIGNPFHSKLRIKQAPRLAVGTQ